MDIKTDNKIPVDIICYDLDGTLAHSLPDIFRSMNLTLEKFNYPKVPEEKIKDFIGDGVMKLVERAVSYSLAGDEDRCIVPSLIKKFFKEYRLIYQDNCTKRSLLYPGVLDILEYFKDKTQILITNKPESMTFKMLDHFNIRGYFTLIVGGDSLPVKKPDTQILHHILDTLNPSLNTNSLVMIGDSDVDILFAKKSKIQSVAVSYGYTDLKNLNKLHPDFMIHSINELKQLFK